MGPLEHRLVCGPSCHPEFLRFPPGTQASSDLRAHPHPTALGLGSAFPVTDLRTRPGLLVRPSGYSPRLSLIAENWVLTFVPGHCTMCLDLREDLAVVTLPILLPGEVAPAAGTPVKHYQAVFLGLR